MYVRKIKLGESLTIADEIEVKVLDVDGKYVTLGVEAPRDIPISHKKTEDRNRVQAREYFDQP